MKHNVITAGLMVLLGAASAAAQTAPPKPGPEHKKLEIWLGDWTSEGQSQATPFGPAGKSSGKATVRPTLDGFFIEFRGEEKTPAGTAQWFEVDGYDPVNKKYFWHSYSSDGGTTMVTYTIDGTTVAFSGTQASGGKQFFVRGTAVFAPDFMSFVEKREMSADGKTWMPLWEVKLTKTKPSLK